MWSVSKVNGTKCWDTRVRGALLFWPFKSPQPCLVAGGLAWHLEPPSARIQTTHRKIFLFTNCHPMISFIFLIFRNGRINFNFAPRNTCTKWQGPVIVTNCSQKIFLPVLIIWVNMIVKSENNRRFVLKISLFLLKEI